MTLSCDRPPARPVLSRLQARLGPTDPPVLRSVLLRLSHRRDPAVPFRSP